MATNDATPPSMQARRPIQARRRRRRSRGPGNESSSAVLTTLFLSAAAVLAGVWYFNREKGDTSLPPESPRATKDSFARTAPVPLSAPRVGMPPTVPLQSWTDLADQKGPLPLPPDDPTANMVLIPAGKFLYGDDNEEIELAAFYIDRCEVSQVEYAQFLRCVRATGDHSHCNRDEPPGKNHTPLNWGRPDITDPQFPVVGLDYWDVCAYAGWVGKRLPTEEEWEKAARGTDGRLYPWGEEWDDRLCNWGPSPDNPRTLLPVDSMPEGKSPFGCHHMLGNAAEWTASFIDEVRRTHCGRGYCWRIGHMIPYRTTFRMPGPTNLRDEGSGLRCALDAP